MVGMNPHLLRFFLSKKGQSERVGWTRLGHRPRRRTNVFTRLKLKRHARWTQSAVGLGFGVGHASLESLEHGDQSSVPVVALRVLGHQAP